MSDQLEQDEGATLVCSLLAEGRIEEAEAAWVVALHNIETQSSSRFSKEQIFQNLHRFVLDKALDFSQLSFANRILNEIPQAVRHNDENLKSCQQRLNALTIANEGRAVVPLPYLQEGWWSDGPFLLPPRLEAGHELLCWFAARVEAVSLTRVRLRIAEIRIGSTDEPEVLIASFSIDQVAQWSSTILEPEEGDFWEIGVYQKDGNEEYRLLVHDKRCCNA